ncbi:beta-1,3-glucanase family protein [Lysobacter firmicutimachus]|uniref:Beta-1,3-glucanase family protein n=1 Tax=Lysobacter firmicutimachus TaxID=1792846 RepID=A0ABU8D7A4_9GAMM
MTVPLTLDATQTDLADDVPVYAYIVGKVPDGFYRLDATGLPQPMQLADNAQTAGSFPGAGQLDPAVVAALADNYPQAWADYSIPLARSGPATWIDLSQINTANLPSLGTGSAAFSGRIYISVGVPRLPFTVQSGGYAAPVPYQDGPGAQCLFDWIEFSYDSDGNFNGNTTQVDQFGFTLILDGAPGGSAQGQPMVSRDAFIAQVQALPAPLAGQPLAIPIPAAIAPAYPTGLSWLRAISPKTLTGDPAAYGTAVSGWFDDEISTWYANWQATPLVVHDVATGYYTGVVDPDSGVLNFYAGQYPTLAGWQAAAPPLAFALTGAAPSTVQFASLDVWQCNNALANGDAAQLNVGKNIAAAFNRGVVGYLLDDADCSGAAAGFYPDGGTWNAWAQLTHAVSANGLAYGFPYDDLCNQNPSIQLNGTQSVGVVLGDFYG